MGPKKVKYKFYFLAVFLVTFLVVLLLLFVVSVNRYRTQKDSLISLYQDQLDQRYREINYLLENIIFDLRIISEFEVFNKFINTDSDQFSDSVAQIFKLVVTERGTFDQIRFIDKDGMEVIRVNYNNGSCVIVPEDQLQFKGDRYYFKETFMLKAGEVFFSPLDLNVENGAVEIPEKPVIRVGIPVFDNQNIRKGIILINYYGKNIIDVVSGEYKNSEEEFFLLNKAGYYLSSPDRNKNFGFMYPDRQNVKFSLDHPLVWSEINREKEGILKVSDGYYIFKTINPLEDYHWKLLVFLPEVIFNNLTKLILFKMKILILISLVAAFLWSFLISKLWYYQRESERKAYESLQEKELLLREIHHRVKNSLALVSSFVGLYQMENPEQINDTFFNALQQKIDSIALVHTHLYQSKDIKNISIKKYITDLLENEFKNLEVHEGDIKLLLDIDNVFLKTKQTINIGLIVSELAVNSLKYAFPQQGAGTVSVSLKKLGSEIKLVYSDNGIGLPDDFQTKNSNSLGKIIIQSLVDQLDGELFVKTGKNSSFTVVFSVS